jgi:predicted PurR-regulated permease PerM
MYCIHCGTSCPENAAFCPKCGKPLHSSDPDKTISLLSTAPLGEAKINGTLPVVLRSDISNISKWIRRVGIPLVTLAWIGVVAVILWAASHIGRSLILLAIAAILAFALAPAVKFLARVMPRIVAILVVYIIVLSGISVVLYFLVKAAVLQITELKGQVGGLLNPNAGGPPSSLQTMLKSLGIGPDQIQNARQAIVSRLGGLVTDIGPFLTRTFDFVLDIIVVAMLSIYLLLDGSRVMRWLRENLPRPQQKRGLFFLDTLEQVVGGYIRGQLTLSLLIGVLVGAGMAIFQVPHPILLGELAFLLAFVPVLGTFISAAACILLSFAATNSWVINLTHLNWILAVIVLIYFVAVHLIESHIVGPRIVGHAVGLHPIISITALIASAELFGILGALFVVPVVGVIQAIIVSFWREWREAHRNQFPKKDLMIESEVSDAGSQPAEAAVETM